MKTIIAGGRDHHITDEDKAYLKTLGITHVISGGAKGVDTDAIEWANENSIPLTVVDAKWDDITAPGAVIKMRGKKKYNLIAGFQRNEEMAKIAEACVIFPGGNGTAHMKKMAEKYSLKLFFR